MTITDRIEINPKVKLMGKPVILGSRLTVELSLGRGKR